MAEQQTKGFEIKVRLKMYDYFRYYLSMFNIKPSGLIVYLLCTAIMLVYSFSLFSLIYIASVSGAFNWITIRGILIDIVVVVLFSTPFTRTYLIAYKDAKTHSFLNKDLDVMITEDKFIVSPDGTRLEYPWKKMYKIFDFSHGFALFIDKKELTFVLPRRCFKNKEQIKFLREIISKNNAKKPK